ncbi:hypothetical protein ACF0H5_020385 [Mactra antiquata]
MTSDWYRPRSQDRTEVGQRKLEELQKQIMLMESEMREQSDLMHKLNRLQTIENEKKDIDEKVLERNSRSNTPRLLKSEMERLYGRESVNLNDRTRSPGVDKSVINSVIQQRTKEFSQKQQEAAMKAKYLDKERQRLQEARRRVEEQRQALLNTSTDPKGGGVKPSGRKSVQGVDSFIKKTVDKLPNTMDKIFKMRENIQSHYQYYKKPYNGELGLSSYEPWQIQDYFACRDIVDEVVENFLNLYFIHDDVVERGTFKAMLDEEKVWMQRQSESIAEKRAMNLINEDIILDVTGEMADEVVKDMHHLYGMFRNITDNLLMSEAEMISTGKDHGRDPADRAYNMITKSYFTVKENRDTHREDVWSHSQFAQNKVKKRKITRKAGGQEVIEEVEEAEDEEEEEEEAPDLTIIDFNTISPVQLRSIEPAIVDSPEVIHEKESFQRYKRREAEYWGKILSSVNQLTFYKKSRGIRLVRTSPNHRFIAVATFHGDIIIYDILMKPWRPIRVLMYSKKTDDPIIDVTWSLDSSRIVTINTLGQLRVLSIVGGPVISNDARLLGLPADDKTILPYQLQPILYLSSMKHDFTFQQGSFAEEEIFDDDDLAPEKSAFFPSLSFLGAQNDIMISLENGDILKCNIENALKPSNIDEEDSSTEAPRIYKPSLVQQEEAANINTIGQNVEAELLRGHKTSIIYITFVEYLNAMITVDQKGFIYKWKYNLKYKSSFGWFNPSRKYKMETSKIMYKESDIDKPKVVFTDQTPEGRKPRTRQEIAAQRRQVQNTLDNMQLGDPWHEEYKDDDDVNLQIFAPRGVIAETGAMFHLVYRHPDTDQLSTYITRLYKPVKVRCERIVRVIGSPSSTELIVVLLFGSYPPKGPHFTIFIIDLKTMELRDFRKDIELSPTSYEAMKKRTIISCDVSRVFGPTGSQYMFIIFNGVLRCVSLTSGQTVAMVGEKKIDNIPDDDENDDDDDDEDESSNAVFKGCIIDQTMLHAPPESECTAVCFEGKIYCVIFARKIHQMYIISFDDRNIYTTRREMWKTYTNLPGHKLVPTELRVNTHNWKLEDIQHPTVNARKILLNKIDSEMRKAALIRDHPKVIRRLKLSDKIENYRVLDKAVSESVLLDKDGIMQKRAVSRLSETTPDLPEDDKF